MVGDAYSSPFEQKKKYSWYLMDASQIASMPTAYPAPSLGFATSAAVLRLLNGRAGLHAAATVIENVGIQHDCGNVLRQVLV